MILISFVHWTTPLMLGGLGLLALPLMAHLLNRRTRRRIVFPTIEFLRKSVADQSQLLKLRRLILLILRALAVALIVLAFARPIWFTSSQQNAADRKCVAIVIDASLSTNQNPRGVSAFETLRDTAKQLLGELTDGQDLATVIFADANSESVFGKLTANLPALREELNDAKPTFGRADWTAAMRIAHTELGEFEGRRQIFVVSDLQRSNWAEFDSAQIRWADTPVRSAVTVVEFEPKATANIGLSHPQCSPESPVIDQQCVISSRISNYSRQPQQISVLVRINGEVRQRQNLTLAPSQTQDASFNLLIESSDPYLVEFEIPRDALDADNRAYLVVGSRRNIPAVIVTHDELDPGSGAYYLARALEPFHDAGNLFDVELARPERIDLQYLNRFELVVLGYTGPLSISQARSLMEFTRNGGTLFMVCGEGNVAANSTILEDAVAEPDGCLPLQLGRLDRLRNMDDWLTISGGKWRNRLLEAFDERSQIALGQIHFRQAWQVRALHPAAEVLLTFSDGRAALATCDCGQGRIAMANFSLSAEQSDFAKYGSFVALMQMVASQLSSQPGESTTPLVGEPIQKRLDGSADLRPSKLSVSGPSNRPAQAIFDTVNGVLQVSLIETNAPGFYRINGSPLSGQASGLLDACAVNVDPRESDLEQIDREQLAERFSIGTAEFVTPRGWNDNLTDAGKPFWPTLLIIAVSLLLIESSLLAWWKS